jgi:glucose-1-phosphate thymidylyltransferase
VEGEKMRRKSILLASASGTRLHSAIIGVCRQLLTVYDKSMINYPLSTLMLAGIKDILIISTPEDTQSFERILGDLGLSTPVGRF